MGRVPGVSLVPRSTPEAAVEVLAVAGAFRASRANGFEPSGFDEPDAMLMGDFVA
jgi:hypothetical protein